MLIDSFGRHSFIRLLHAAPDAPPVDIYANSRKIASYLPFKNLTGYLQIRPGKYDIEVYPAGLKTKPVLTSQVTVPPKTYCTIAVIGKLEYLNLLLIEDITDKARRERMISQPRRQNTYIRFIHLSPNAPAVDIAAEKGRVLFKNVKYREITNYITVDPGTYCFYVFIAGTDQKVLEVKNLVAQPDLYYSIYALGLVDDEPELQTIIPLDGI